MENNINREEIMERLDNMTKLIDEKDALIKELAEKNQSSRRKCI